MLLSSISSASQSCMNLFSSNPNPNISSSFDAIKYPVKDKKSGIVSSAKGSVLWKMEPVFTKEETDHILEIVPTEKDSQIDTRDYTHLKGAFYWNLRLKLGKSIADKVIKIADEFQDEIKKRTNASFFTRVYLRAGRRMVNVDGHVHLANSITFTKAERGLGSWVRDNEDRTKIYQLGPDDAILFTDEYHGSPEPDANRVLILIEANFRSPFGAYFTDWFQSF